VRTVRTCMWLAAFCWTMATSWFPKPKWACSYFN
jgi:hypothetical protein